MEEKKNKTKKTADTDTRRKRGHQDLVLVLVLVWWTTWSGGPPGRWTTEQVEDLCTRRRRPHPHQAEVTDPSEQTDVCFYKYVLLAYKTKDL